MEQVSQLTLVLDGETHHLECRPGESILDAALRNDIDAPYACMAGTCNACQAHLDEGTVHMDVCDALSEDEVEQGEVLTCQAVCTSPVVKIRYPD